MIIKKEGKVNEIVYEYTTYHSGKSRLYPTITDLNEILAKIIESKSTTDYLRINPFYINEKVNLQMEFENYMFYLECREHFDEESQKSHILDCLDVHYPTVSTEQYEIGKILYPICQHNDVDRYRLSLEKYLDYLHTLLPRLFEIVKVKMQLIEDDLAFGYFCFEVYSG